MKTISQVISELESIRAQHGDLRVVTPGFDESNYSDVDDIGLIWLRIDAGSSSLCGEHVEAPEAHPDSQPCVCINF